MNSLGQSRSEWYIFRQKVVWITSEGGDGRVDKPPYDVAQCVGVKRGNEAELGNQRRGPG